MQRGKNERKMDEPEKGEKEYRMHWRVPTRRYRSCISILANVFTVLLQPQVIGAFRRLAVTSLPGVMSSADSAILWTNVLQSLHVPSETYYAVRLPRGLISLLYDMSACSCGGTAKQQLHCVQKKEIKRFFCNISYKTRAIFFVISPIKLGRCWWNLVHHFLNKCLQNDANVSHLTWIMPLHYLVKLEMLIAHVLPSGFYRKKLSFVLDTL